MHLQAKAIEDLLMAKDRGLVMPSKIEESISYNNKSTQTFELQKDSSLFPTGSHQQPSKQAERPGFHVSFNPKDRDLNKDLKDSKLSKRDETERNKASEDLNSSPDNLLNFFMNKGNSSQKKQFSTFCTRRSEALIVNHPLLYNSEKEGFESQLEGKEARRTKITERNAGHKLVSGKPRESEGKVLGRQMHSKSRDDLIIRPMLELKSPLTPKTQNKALFEKATGQLKSAYHRQALGKQAKESESSGLGLYKALKHETSPALTDTRKNEGGRAKGGKGSGVVLDRNKPGKDKATFSGLNESLLYSLHRNSASNGSNYGPRRSISEESEARRLKRDVPCVDSNLRKVKRIVVERDTLARASGHNSGEGLDSVHAF